MVEIDRGPYYKILDKMALARQAETGESYAKAFTEVYTDPANVLIRDGAAYDDLAKAFELGLRDCEVPDPEGRESGAV